jgi:hypothetical protein
MLPAAAAAAANKGACLIASKSRQIKMAWNLRKLIFVPFMFVFVALQKAFHFEAAQLAALSSSSSSPPPLPVFGETVVYSPGQMNHLVKTSSKHSAVRHRTKDELLDENSTEEDGVAADENTREPEAMQTTLQLHLQMPPSPERIVNNPLVANESSSSDLQATVIADNSTAAATVAVEDVQTPSVLHYIEGTVDLEIGTITYRVPRQTVEYLNQNTRSSKAASRILTGVLSYERNKRDTVRNTWARNHDKQVWFVVAGTNWSTIEHEFMEQQDLLWVNVSESYRGITSKVQGLFAAIHQQITQYEYILKTDDDSYVRLNNLVASTRPGGNHENSTYWGACNFQNSIIRKEGHKWQLPDEFLPGLDFYPPYAYGAGYVLKRSMVQCLLAKMKDIHVMPIEDAYVGAVLQLCNATCDDDHASFLPWYYMSFTDDSKPRTWVLLHELKRESSMLRVHENTCCQYGHRLSAACKGFVCDKTKKTQDHYTGSWSCKKDSSC